MKEFFQKKQEDSQTKAYVIHTCAEGYDLFSEEMERVRIGTYRLYMPKKSLRIVKKTFPHKSSSGRFFKRLKINLENSNL